MRIAIITQFGDNYGNKLQNYALQTLLESMGYKVETIIVKDGIKFHHPESKKDSLLKYRPKYISQVISSRFKNKHPYKNQRDGIRASIKFGKTDNPKKLNYSRSEGFKRFAKQRLHISENVLIPGGRYTDNYDAYICGSDQIWNPSYSSTGAAYFLQFAPKYKRIAFAPSFGVSKIADELKPLYKKWLDGIPYLSVREEKGAQIINELTGRSVPVLPDPTLCLSGEQWEFVEKKPAFTDEQPYILTYFLGNETNKYRRFIEAYSKHAGAKIINLFDMREPEYYAADPAEFVWLIHHAKAMFTDSFHGSVFSIIFHTPFLVFDRVESGGKGMSSRIETLLQMTGLESRQFDGKVNLEGFSNLDFSNCDKAIEERFNIAKAFLSDSLNSVADAAVDAENSILSRYVWADKRDCTGCAACVDACPVGCIKMEPDEEGFRYPKIDLDKCIHCDRCRMLCNNAKAEVSEDRGEKAFVSYSKDTVVRASSSSGGMFTELANRIIDMNGSVYGVGFAEDWRAVHQCVSDKAGIEKLRGSKYVQSEMDFCFQEIRKKLEQNQLVYFSGTPCQVDGLLAYLNKDYDNLFTQDIICHGVPSPEVWESYTDIRSNGQPIKSISFRDKTYGWHYFSMRINTEKKKYVKRLDGDTFIRLFLDNVILRPSCYDCRHKHLHRKVDITIADCWGDTYGVKDDDKGISLAFANTEKGQRLINEIRANLEIKEIPFEKAASSQGAMTKSVPYNQNRDLFFSMVKELGMEKTLEKWYGSSNPMLRKIGYRKYKLARCIRKR